MPYDPGCILLVASPFTDQSSSKHRPVLVVSIAALNKGEDSVVVPFSSQVLEDDEFGLQILDTEPYFEQTGLRRSSTIKWTKPFVISSKVVLRKLGTLPPDVLQRVQRLVQSVFGGA